MRYLGPERLGQYSFVLAFVSLFALFCDLGLGQLVTREISQDRSRGSAYLGNYLYLEIILSLLVFSVMSIFIVHLAYPLLIKLALYIAGLNLILSCLAQPFLIVAISFERLRYNALITIISNIFYCLFILAVIFFHKGLLSLITVTLFTTCLELILAAYVCLRFCVRPSWKFDKLIWLTVANSFIPFALYMVFTGLYRRIDIVMLSHMAGDAAVGFYSAALKIIYLFLLIPTSFSKALFPFLSQEAKTKGKGFNLTVYSSMKYLVAISLPIALSGTFLSKKIVLILFGETFLSSSNALSILIWTVVLVFWHSTLSQALIACDKMVPVVYGTIAAFICNLGLNFMLIPKYSYIGASWAMLLSEFLAGCWFYSALHQRIQFRHPFIEFTKLLMAGAVMASVLGFCYQYHLLAAITLGMVFYITVLWIVKFINPAEKVILQQIWE